MKIAPIKWSEEMRPNKEVRYDHVIGKTPFFVFEITWKGWKEFPSFSLDCFELGIFSDHATLDDAKEAAQKGYEDKINQCFISEDIEKDG